MADDGSGGPGGGRQWPLVVVVAAMDGGDH